MVYYDQKICDVIGSPKAARLEFDSSSQMLTCTSTGGPIATIVWRRDQTLLIEYNRTQRIDDVSSATYVNTLSLNQVHPKNVIGLYECSASNSRGMTKAQFHIHGERSELNLLIFNL